MLRSNVRWAPAHGPVYFTDALLLREPESRQWILHITIPIIGLPPYHNDLYPAKLLRWKVDDLSNPGGRVDSQYHTGTLVQGLCYKRSSCWRAMYVCYKDGLGAHCEDWDFVHLFVMEMLEQKGLHLEFSVYPLIYLVRYRAYRWAMVHHIIHIAASAHFFSLHLPVPSPSANTTWIMSSTAILTSVRYRSC